MKMLSGIVQIGLVLLGLGLLIPYLWPLIEDTLTSVEGMSGGDSTAVIQMYWPIILIVVAVAIGIAIVLHALRSMGVIGGKK